MVVLGAGVGGTVAPVAGVFAQDGPCVAQEVQFGDFDRVQAFLHGHLEMAGGVKPQGSAHVHGAGMELQSLLEYYREGVDELRRGGVRAVTQRVENLEMFRFAGEDGVVVVPGIACLELVCGCGSLGAFLLLAVLVCQSHPADAVVRKCNACEYEREGKKEPGDSTHVPPLRVRGLRRRAA